MYEEGNDVLGALVHHPLNVGLGVTVQDIPIQQPPVEQPEL